MNRLFLIGSSFRIESHLSRNYWAEEPRHVISIQVYSHSRRSTWVIQNGRALFTGWDVKVESSNERIKQALYYLAFTYTVNNPGRLVSVNISSTSYLADESGPQPACDSTFPSINNAVASLAAQRIHVVAAAGNERRNGRIGWPACNSGVLAVALTDNQDVVPEWATVSSRVALLAPGIDVRTSTVSSFSTSLYVPDAGSSIAAPHVAGAIAVLRQKYPAESNDFILEQLRQSGVSVPLRDTGMSAPRIDLRAALYLQDNQIWRQILPAISHILLQ